MYRQLQIEAVANGFIAHVGCQRLVYTGESREIAAKRLCTDLEAYLIDPDKTEAEALKAKCFNARHTMNDQIAPAGECLGAANAPPPGEPYPEMASARLGIGDAECIGLGGRVLRG